MNLPFTWLAGVLRAAGLNVVEHDGWKTRTARTSAKTTWGVLCHHDAARPSSSRARVTPGMIRDGHSALAGPISQLLITDDCKVHVIAAGTANHAGKGLIPGTLWTDGNARLLGIEVNNSGVGEQWSAGLLETYCTTVAACLRHLGLGSDRAIAHKEFAVPRGRKIDPFGPWDPSWHRAPFPGQSWAQMAKWRAIVAERIDELNGQGPAKPPPDPDPTTPTEAAVFLAKLPTDDAVWAIGDDLKRAHVTATAMSVLARRPEIPGHDAPMVLTQAELDAFPVR